MDMNGHNHNLDLKELIILTITFGSALAALHFFFGTVFNTNTRSIKRPISFRPFCVSDSDRFNAVFCSQQ